MYNKLTLLEYL